MFFTPIRQRLEKCSAWAIASFQQVPPKSVGYGFYWFRIGLGLFMLISLALSLGGCTPATVWQKADGMVETALVEKAITENTFLPVEEGKKTLVAWKIAGREGDLVLFSYNRPDTCGSLGCLYTGYWEHQGASQRVLAAYFDPNQPAGSQVIQVAGYSAEENQSLPCLQINQPLQKDKQRRQVTYCLSLSGQEYRPIQGGVIDHSKPPK